MCDLLCFLPGSSQSNFCLCDVFSWALCRRCGRPFNVPCDVAVGLFFQAAKGFGWEPLDGCSDLVGTFLVEQWWFVGICHFYLRFSSGHCADDVVSHPMFHVMLPLDCFFGSHQSSLGVVRWMVVLIWWPHKLVAKPWRKTQG